MKISEETVALGNCSHRHHNQERFGYSRNQVHVKVHHNKRVTCARRSGKSSPFVSSKFHKKNTSCFLSAATVGLAASLRTVQREDKSISCHQLELILKQSKRQHKSVPESASDYVWHFSFKKQTSQWNKKKHWTGPFLVLLSISSEIHAQKNDDNGKNPVHKLPSFLPCELW